MHFLSHTKKVANARRKFCNATIFALLGALSACATPMSPGDAQWAAYGYLTPEPSSEPELIGIFNSIKECEAAADAWTSRQVVGNPIFAECYPVDRN